MECLSSSFGRCLPGSRSSSKGVGKVKENPKTQTHEQKKERHHEEPSFFKVGLIGVGIGAAGGLSCLGVKSSQQTGLTRA